MFKTLSGFIAIITLIFLIFFIQALLMITNDEYTTQEPKVKDSLTIQESKAKDNLIISGFSWNKCKYSKVCWKVYVLNQNDKAIKDIHFKMYYYAKSGTMIDTGEETIYEIIKGGEKRWFEFDEYLQDQVVSAGIVIDNAKWIDEKGKVYLDW